MELYDEEFSAIESDVNPFDHLPAREVLADATKVNHVADYFKKRMEERFGSEEAAQKYIGAFSTRMGEGVIAGAAMRTGN